MTRTPQLRRYRGFMADSDRWRRFDFRHDDVVITTPSKCGTSWMQTIVGMLLLDRVDLGVPISRVSPWLDMQIHAEHEVFDRLGRQRHRRFIKTHTPLDGVPRHASVTYIAVIRHPLDVALSDRDHGENMRTDVAADLRASASGPIDPEIVLPERGPDDPGEYLRWFIDNDNQPIGSGPYGLADYCQQVLTYWHDRASANVHLFHYADLWSSLEGEMRRVAAILGAPVEEDRWPAFVDAARLDSMRTRARVTAPESDHGIWHSPQAFFRVGGTRDWASLLNEDDIDHFHDRLRALAGDATEWVLRGRAALEGSGL
ncbi:MAG TPA: sulfotransferase domain-containing protein [Actinomycetota bacterium]